MDILLLRGIERLAIVLIGSIAIDVGYRLFLPVKAEAEDPASSSACSAAWWWSPRCILDLQPDPLGVTVSGAGSGLLA